MGLSTVWSVSDGKQVGQFGADAPVKGVAFHPGGRTLATLDAEGAVHVFDVTAK
jgi:hypothetical protein